MSTGLFCLVLAEEECRFSRKERKARRKGRKAFIFYSEIYSHNFKHIASVPFSIQNFLHIKPNSLS